MLIRTLLMAVLLALPCVANAAEVCIDLKMRDFTQDQKNMRKALTYLMVHNNGGLTVPQPSATGVCFTDPVDDPTTYIDQTKYLLEYATWKNANDAADVAAAALLQDARDELATNKICEATVEGTEAFIVAVDWTNTNEIKDVFRDYIRCQRAKEVLGRRG